MYDLPKSLEVNGREYEIRSDYRPILDILETIVDPELSEQEKAQGVLTIFYPDADAIPPEDCQEAINRCFWFIAGGQEDEGGKRPRLVEWEQDFPYIVSPINRVLGMEIRAIPYDAESNTGGLHWWTFLGAYMEIGECTFSQIVRIRERKATGKRLDKQDQEWYRKNRKLVDIKTHYTEAEKELLKEWG